MKRLLIAVMLLSTSNIVHAEGVWVGPAVLGGLIGYIAGRNQAVYSFQPREVYTPPPVIYYETTPQPTPIYGYDWIYDQSCFCSRQILVRLN